MEPVGVPPPGATAATLHVDFTFCPTRGEAIENVGALVVVAAGLTVCARPADADGRWLVDPA